MARALPHVPLTKARSVAARTGLELDSDDYPNETDARNLLWKGEIGGRQQMRLRRTDYGKSLGKFNNFVRRTPKPRKSGSEAELIFLRTDKRLNHFGLDVVAVEVVKFLQPKVIALKVQVCLRRVIRISSQVAKVLH